MLAFSALRAEAFAVFYLTKITPSSEGSEPIIGLNLFWVNAQVRGLNLVVKN